MTTGTNPPNGDPAPKAPGPSVAGPSAPGQDAAGDARRLPGGTSGPPAGRPDGSVVVGVDRDEVGRAVLPVAVDLGRRLRARLHVVHVVDPGDFPVDPDDPGWEEQGARTLAAEREDVRRTLAGYEWGWSYQTWYGDPATTLAAVAETHDALLVVVGRHAAGLPEVVHRLTGGSVSRRLLDRSARPVLLVPLRSRGHAGRRNR
jgi:nucleotide-binding universal stress UspA family protein